jgi:hypothetical protein
VRTSIFLGLLYIGDALGKPMYDNPSNVVAVYAISLLAFVVMDIVDFFRRKAG